MRSDDGRRAARGAQRESDRVGALDGLRGIALIAVVLYHAAPDVARGGFLGVEVFFVLSGYLLTWLLLDEHKRTGAIDAVAYAGRRFRRIFPAMLVLLSALAVVRRFVAPEDADRLAGDIVSSTLGLTNWHLISDGSSYFAQVGRPPLVRHLWSIAVELQAYLVLPFIALFVARRPRRVAAAGLAAGIWASATLMALLYANPDPYRAYYGTDTRIGALLTGALVATVVARWGGSSHTSINSRGVGVLGGVAAIVLLLSLLIVDERWGFLYPAGFLITQGATATLIATALHPGVVARVLDEPLLKWFGTRSYGIYLWHWPLVALTNGARQPRAIVAAFTTAAAVLLGDLSYRFVERPAMTRTGWVRRPLPRAARLTVPAWAVASAVLVAILASTTTVDPIKRSLLEGEKTLAQQDADVNAFESELRQTKTVSGVLTGAQAQPAPAAHGTLPAASGPKKGTVKVTAVGDSVMLGAAGRMKSRFGKTSYIDALKNRRFGEGVEVVKSLRKKKRLGPILVVHLGNNGPASKKDVDALMAQAKDVDHVLLVTVRVTKPWQDGVNATLKEADKRYKKIVLVSWYRTSKGHPDWFYSDGTHMNGKGAEAYTKLVAASIPPKPTPGLLDPLLVPA